MTKKKPPKTPPPTKADVLKAAAESMERRTEQRKAWDLGKLDSILRAMEGVSNAHLIVRPDQCALLAPILRAHLESDLFWQKLNSGNCAAGWEVRSMIYAHQKETP